ncbi:MAG: hypothetical protein IJI09_06840 [Clostridia bacterium]|nr:hypothetical protein [Clostridia bacterium]
MPMTHENNKLNNKIRKLAPDAIDSMGDMLRDPNTPAPTKAQLIGFILERTLGKPDTTIHLTQTGQTVKESENRLIAIAEEIRAEQDTEFKIQDPGFTEDAAEEDRASQNDENGGYDTASGGMNADEED